MTNNDLEILVGAATALLYDYQQKGRTTGVLSIKMAVENAESYLAQERQDHDC